jgi:hypothetical protein
LIQVKIFSDTSPIEVEKQVNEFLAKIPEHFIVDVKLGSSSREDGTSNLYTDALVIYKSGQQANTNIGF